MIPTSNTSFGMGLAMRHNRLKRAFDEMFKKGYSAQVHKNGKELFN